MKHWVFDLDGTLVDSFSHYFVTLEKIFARSGKTFTPDLRLVALTEPLAEFFPRYLGASAVESAFEQLQSESNDDSVHIRPFEGLLDGVREVAENGGRVAVWTNRDLTSAELILRHSGLRKYVELCVSGTCVGLRKPHPEGLQRILRHFECGPESVTMVGDHEHDVTAAKQVGVRAVRASWHSYWTMEACSYADHQFHCAKEFVSWMRDHVRG